MLRFGLRVVEIRKSRRVTQEELAERVGLSIRQMNRLEGGRANIGLITVAELGRALNVQVSRLFLAPRPHTKRRPGRPPKK